MPIYPRPEGSSLSHSLPQFLFNSALFLEAPTLRSYWWLMTTERKQDHFLSPWVVVHAPADDPIPMNI